MGVIADRSTDPRAISRANRIALFAVAMPCINIGVMVHAVNGGFEGYEDKAIIVGSAATTIGLAVSVFWLMALGWRRGTWVHASLAFVAAFLWVPLLVVDFLALLLTGLPGKC